MMITSQMERCLNPFWRSRWRACKECWERGGKTRRKLLSLIQVDQSDFFTALFKPGLTVALYFSYDRLKKKKSLLSEDRWGRLQNWIRRDPAATRGSNNAHFYTNAALKTASPPCFYYRRVAVMHVAFHKNAFQNPKVDTEFTAIITFRRSPRIESTSLKRDAQGQRRSEQIAEGDMGSDLRGGRPDSCSRSIQTLPWKFDRIACPSVAVGLFLHGPQLEGVSVVSVDRFWQYGAEIKCTLIPSIITSDVPEHGGGGRGGIERSICNLLPVWVKQRQRVGWTKT